jgi:hypothetical protein
MDSINNNLRILLSFLSKHWISAVAAGNYQSHQVQIKTSSSKIQFFWVSRVISDNTIWPILGSVSLTWQHTIQQELLPSFIMYPVAFWHFRTSLILFCMFLLTGWLNLITDTLLCPITCGLGAPVQLSMSGNLHTWASYLVWSHKSSVHVAMMVCQTHQTKYSHSCLWL